MGRARPLPADEQFRAVSDAYARAVVWTALNFELFDDVFRPIPAVLDRDSVGAGLEFHEYARAWLDGRHDRVGRALVVDSPIGSGKTVALAQFQCDLQADARAAGVLDLYVPFRDINPRDDDPCDAVRRALGAANVNLPMQPVRLLLLDGLDEVLVQFERDAVFAWLGRLVGTVGRLSRQPMRVIVSCRDFVQRDPRLRHDLWEALRGLPHNQTADPEAAVVRLRRWEDKYCRSQLEHLLGKAGVCKPADRVRDVLGTEFDLSSPLLLRLAYQFLRARPGADDEVPVIKSERDLVRQWVNEILRTQPNGASFAVEALRATAENVSLHLVRSGRGPAGVTLDELAHPDQDWVTAHLPPMPRPQRDLVLARLCLLSSRPLAAGEAAKPPAGELRLAPFHARILHHLAAWALDRFAGPRDDDPSGPDPGGNAPRHPPLPPKGSFAVAAELGERLGRPNLASAVAFLGDPARLHAGASDPQDPLHEVLQFFAEEARAAPVKSKLHVVPSLVPGTDAVSISVRDAALGLSGVTAPAVASAGRRVIGRQEFLALAGGRHFIWRVDDEGRRVLREVSFGPAGSVFLQAGLVTAGQYADFLRSPEGRGAATALPEAARRALAEGNPKRRVTGVGRAEAQLFCEWFGRSAGADPRLTFGLPTADELRAAVGGPDALPPLVAVDKGSGPLGHSDLTGLVWQWTDDDRLFGGSEALAADPLDRARFLVKWFPDLTAAPEGTDPATVGFRVAARLAGLGR